MSVLARLPSLIRVQMARRPQGSSGVVRRVPLEEQDGRTLGRRCYRHPCGRDPPGSILASALIIKG